MSLKYLIDTDVCSEAIMGNPKVYSQLASLPREDWAISSLVYAELQFGLEKGKLRDESRQALAMFLKSAAVVAFDKRAAIEAAVVRAKLELLGKPSGAIDQLIAGHAISLGLRLVTSNLRHFESVPGLQLENWN